MSEARTSMRRRPSARLLILDPAGRVLLFRFVHKSGALAGEDYWATPGGGVQAGETFAQAALRELEEETGIRSRTPGPELARREFALHLETGETVWADERYFVVAAASQAVSRDGWTVVEQNVMTEHKWWSTEELAATTETFWPDNLIALIGAAARTGIGGDHRQRAGF
jgi:8-oxo-dGTP diphosphatase